MSALPMHQMMMRQATSMGRPLRTSDLRTDAVYYRPRGRMCKLMPAPLSGICSNGEQFHFEYVGAKGEGFWLAAGNVGIMRIAGGRP